MSIATSAPLPTLLFAALAAITVAGCGVHIDLDDAERRVENDTVSANGLTGVDITTRNGAIEVIDGTHDEIGIRTTLVEEDEDDADYSIDVVGDRLVVNGECDAGWFDDCRVAFAVTVPPDLDVDVSTDNGHVSIEGVAGDVTIETDNGAIQAAALSSSAVEAQTDNGRITLQFDRPPNVVETDTDNGSIEVRLPDDGEHYDVDASSDNGSIDVEVRTDPDAGHRVSARSDNGSIDVDYVRTS